MKTLWIFSFPDPSLIPSEYVGGVKIANYLNIQKIIFLKNHDAEKTLDFYSPSVLIISKAIHPNIINLAKIARSRKIKVIGIFNDWHFEPKNLK